MTRAGVMFKPNPDSIEFESSVTTATDQTFSLIMKYLKFGSLMYRLDAGLAKYRESPPILRCSVNDWKSPERMFIGVDDWELKLHLALGIARGIRAMHADCVWHRDLKSSNVLINEYNAFDVQCPPHLSFIFNLDVAVYHQFLPLRDSSHNVTQDVLAIAAAREFGAYPFDMEPDSPSCSSSVPATTPRTPDSFISEICKGIGMSDQCIDHAEYLYSYFILRDNHHDDVRLDSTRDCIAATCVYLAEQASQTGPSCSIDNISSAFKCSVSDITRLKSKLYTLEPKGSVPIPVFYAYVCDFGLSKVSFSCSCILPCLMKAFFPLSHLGAWIQQITM
jgi:serine/threonine protein kinase